MQEHRPSSDFEASLQAAYDADDQVECLVLLRGAQLLLPITEAASAGHETPAWATFAGPDRVWLLAFTSIEAMQAATNGAATHGRISSLPELAAAWPDHSWGLAINPDLPAHFLLESGAVARLAAPTLAQLIEADRDDDEAEAPVLQKVLRTDDLISLIGEGETRVSGYVHQLTDVAHIATPTVLADSLALPADVVTESGSINLLRWRPVGAELYRSPYGGRTVEAMQAVEGWVVDEPPFVGLGFAPNPDELIREYKVDGIVLPHGAEIWELDIDGVEHRRAVLDGDRGVWTLVRRAVKDDTAPPAPPRLSARRPPEERT